MTKSAGINAQVIGVFPDKLRISVVDLEDFKAGESLKVGSYLKVIGDDNETHLIAMIENFSIAALEEHVELVTKHIIEAQPLGVISDGKFTRGGDDLTLPPKDVKPATEKEIKQIFLDSVEENKQFKFSKLSSNPNIDIPVDGDRFFNKHIAVVGSTGSGKSHTIASLLQKATNEKEGEYKGLNNSHIIIFDIHSEYKSAFPGANYLDVNNLVLPYWLLNSDELEDVLLDVGERDNYNQSAVFRMLVTANKKKWNPEVDKIFYDSPFRFDIHEVKNAIYNLKEETKNAKNSNNIMFKDKEGKYLNDKGEITTTIDSGELLSSSERLERYFEKEHEFYGTRNSHVSRGEYADNTLDKFFVRFQEKIQQDRLEFLFGEKAKEIEFEEVMKTLLGYDKENKSNVTIIDLSGIPFEVLSITVALISRVVFEFGYIYKRLQEGKQQQSDIPFLLVYEEAHQYVPKSELSKYRSSKQAIERIAKEGRKYGVTLLLASQRPSEISETIFSQCNNFIAMRLTNPSDQQYVEKLLPDTMGSLVGKMPSLKQGEALLVGESIVLPSIVQIEECSPAPSSSDIPYWKLWKEEWKNLDIKKLKEEWYK